MRSRSLVRLVLAFGGLVVAALATPASAQSGGDGPVLLQADRMTYASEIGVVTARGKVEISQGERTLMADTVSYNERTNTVTASGNVVLMEPNGDVFFADYVELTDAFKNGAIKGFRARLADRSRFAAVDAERRDGNRTIMRRAVYTRCDDCTGSAARPFWQVRAYQVIHDQEAGTIIYKDAFVDLFGVPVFYTPYFEHPDPTVKRRSGLLAPTFGSSRELGFQATIPYFWNIAPNRDLTFSPRITSKEGVLWNGEYRAATASGRYQFDGAVTYVNERDDANRRTGSNTARGFIRGDGLFDLNRRWRWGYDLFRASDDTFLRRYDISNADTLTTSLFLEGFNGRSYAAVSSFAFQGLRQDDVTNLTPFVVPFMEYHYVGEPGRYGGAFDLNADGVMLVRTGGSDTRRLSLDGGWTVPRVGPLGGVYTLNARLRTDAYWVNNVQSFDPTATSSTALSGRFWPLAALEWRYPLVRRSGSIRQTIEPIVQFIASPNGSNPSDIPNEDSQSFEFDDTNVFSLNRFPGKDRVESGSRLNYGLKAGIYGRSGGYSNLVIGQSFRFTDTTVFPQGSGLDDTVSDIVGRVTLAPSEVFDYVFRFRYDPTRNSLRRHESYVTLGPPDYRLKVGYFFLARELTVDNFGRREEINTTANVRISRFWTAFGGYRRDLATNNSISASFGLKYECDCVDLRIALERDFTSDRDAKSSTSLFFRLRFKGLG